MDLVELSQLTVNELRTLIQNADIEGACISVIMPVQQETDKRVENHIRLKNLIRAAQEELASLDFRPPDVERLLAPAVDLVRGGRFWATKNPGLAIYLAQDFSRAYQLPYAPEEMVTVGPHFMVKPLMPLCLNETFYILALSQQEVRLLRGTQYTIERMDLSGMPQSLAEALRWDDPERELQWHSQTGADGDARSAMFHGHGVGTKEMHKENLLRYFQLLDQGVSRLLANEDAPLVLAGVDYLLPIFRVASAYDCLIEQEITGSHEHLEDAELQRRAWQLARPYFRRKRQAAVSLYHQQASKSLASADLKTVVPAAHQGRVGTLFVAINEQRWGDYDPESGQISLHSQRQPGDVDLLNLASIQTVLTGGDLYTTQREDLPEAEPLAAILRF